MQMAKVEVPSAQKTFDQPAIRRASDYAYLSVREYNFPSQIYLCYTGLKRTESFTIQIFKHYI